MCLMEIGNTRQSRSKQHTSLPSVKGSAQSCSVTLLQQYVMDQWLKIEEQRLQFIRDNQVQLHVDQYRRLMDNLEKRQ